MLSFFGILIFIPIALLILVVWMCGRIVAKAGYSAWWGVLILVPIVDLVLIWLFAFMEWPAESE